MPTNVAIVLAVSLLSIALLISAIVIVAITLYPSNEDTDDDEQMIRLVDRSGGADNDDDLVFVAEADAPDLQRIRRRMVRASYRSTIFIRLPRL